MFNRWRLSWRLGAAVCVVAISVAFRLFFLGVLEDRLIYITLFPAVAIACVLGGVSGGVLAALLAAVAAHVLMAPLSSDADLAGLLSFFLSSAIIIGITKLLRMALESIAAVERIRQSEQQIGQFIELAPAAMAMFDMDMRYLAVSRRWRDDYHLDRDVLGKSHYAVFPEISDAWKEVHRRALAGETLRAEEEAFRRPNGAVQWLRWEVRPWFHRQDDIGGIVIFSEDITERVKSREELRARDEALRALANNLPDSVIYRYTYDASGKLRFLFVSAGIEKLYGVTAEQVLADAGAMYRLILPEYLPSLIEAQQSSFHSGSDFTIEAPIRRPDGEVRWMRLRSRPVRQADGQIVWHGVQGDITEIRETLEALRDSERQFKAVFDTSMEGIVTIDRRGIMVAVNPAAADMFGYAIDELLGRNVGMLMAASDTPTNDSSFDRYLPTADKGVIGGRRRLLGLRKNGETFLKELSVTEAAIGHEVLFIGFMRDLSLIEDERRRVDDLRDELARVSRMNDMGEVVAGLAHELGQPLAAIRNYSFAGRAMLQSDGSSPIRDLIDKIEKQAMRGGDIISRLRSFIEKRDVSRAPQKLHRLIAEATSLAGLGSGELASPLKLDLLGAEIEVCVDRVQIEQVLVNFLRNAADATALEPKPQIVVATAVETPGFVRVSVSDNGPGVDPGVAGRLFSPFVTTKKLGMGVGLSLCKTIIESHGGTIGFGANPPCGAVFFFTLPFLVGPSRDEAI
jgi:two-component system sensor kinase FixL